MGVLFQEKLISSTVASPRCLRQRYGGAVEMGRIEDRWRRERKGLQIPLSQLSWPGYPQEPQPQWYLRHVTQQGWKKLLEKLLCTGHCTKHIICRISFALHNDLQRQGPFIAPILLMGKLRSTEVKFISQGSGGAGPGSASKARAAVFSFCSCSRWQAQEIHATQEGLG